MHRVQCCNSRVHEDVMMKVIGAHLCMIVRNLTDDVVQNMRVANVVEGNVQEAVTTVHCGQSAPQPIPLQHETGQPSQDIYITYE